MKQKKRIPFRLFSLFLLALILFSPTMPLILKADAASVTKTEKSYDIAVVFDNSASMYNIDPSEGSDGKAWCRAKYAMEIFASMVNYSKDKLHIFPMWEVTTDGSRPAKGKGGSYAPIEIKSKADVDKISNMFTVRPSYTPFAPITEAHEYLQSSSADEKWLIILTDGRFDEEARGKKAKIDLAQRLPALATGGIKVQYLGFGGAQELTPNEGKNFFSKKSSATSLKDDLVEICNSMFQRSILPAKSLNGTSLSIDLSMKNVIVFAQGHNAKIASLKNSSGKEVSVSFDSGQRKYSQIKANGKESSPVDDTLAGQVVTFGACSKGEYTLSYSDADSIQIFYEPDVDIEVTLTDSEGKKVTNPEDLVSGDYTVTSRIVDSVTREDVTDHELMGKNVQLKTYYKTSKDSEYKEYANGDKITFLPDEKAEIYIEGKYLEKYKISSRDDPNLAWLKGFKISAPPTEFEIRADVLQSQSWYKISDHKNWKPVKVSLLAEGRPLTPEQMARTTLTVTPSPALKYRISSVPEESAYYVYIAQDDNGTYAQPETGDYDLDFSASYTDEYDKVSADEDDVSFEVQIYDKFWRWLFWILLILFILFVIMAILNHPVMPSEVYLSLRRSCQRVKMNGTSVALSTDLYPGEIRCEAKPCTPLKNRGKTIAAFEIKSLRPIGSVNWFEIDGTRFKKSKSGKYLNDDSETVDQVKPKIRVSDDTELKWNTNRHTVTGRIFINHKD